MMGEPAVLGDSLPRLEATAKTAGSADFTGDLVLPRMLHGAVVTSPYPHARILSYDIDAALAVSGARAVVTGLDIPRRRFGPVRYAPGRSWPANCAVTPPSTVRTEPVV